MKTYFFAYMPEVQPGQTLGDAVLEHERQEEEAAILEDEAVLLEGGSPDDEDSAEDFILVEGGADEVEVSMEAARRHVHENAGGLASGFGQLGAALAKANKK